jgi:cardiolipin synthase
MIPIFGYFLLTGQYLIGVVLFIIAGFTDVLDGLIARRFNMVTSWGKFADPMADKFMQVTALVILAMKGIIPLAIIIIVVAKEVLIAIGSIMLYEKDDIVVTSNWYGKLATVVFYLAIVMAIIFRINNLKSPYTDIFVNTFMVIAVLASLFALLMYFLTYRKIHKEIK